MNSEWLTIPAEWYFSTMGNYLFKKKMVNKKKVKVIYLNTQYWVYSMM